MAGEGGGADQVEAPRQGFVNAAHNEAAAAIAHHAVNRVSPPRSQQVTFDYTAYNEAAATIDSSYRKGAPAQTQLGIQGLIPGAGRRRGRGHRAAAGRGKPGVALVRCRGWHGRGVLRLLRWCSVSLRACSLDLCIALALIESTHPTLPHPPFHTLLCSPRLRAGHQGHEARRQAAHRGAARARPAGARRCRPGLLGGRLQCRSPGCTDLHVARGHGGPRPPAPTLPPSTPPPPLHTAA